MDYFAIGYPKNHETIQRTQAHFMLSELYDR